MKKILLPILAGALLAGCATIQPVGTVMTNVQVPIAVTSSSADISKLKNATGWEPQYPLEETIKETLDNWRNIIKQEVSHETA